MTQRLTGKVAIVTGSTSGIGEGIAVRLASEGAAMIVTGPVEAPGQLVVEQIHQLGGQAIFVRADLISEADCAALIQAAVDHYGRLDVLVNNAGIYPHTEFEQITLAEWDQVFAVNLRGPFLCCRAAVPRMRQQGGGSIVNIGTTLAYRGRLNRLAYSCSKSALLALTKTLARELAHDRIRANWITVGWVATSGEIELRNQTHGDGESYLRQQSEQRPFGRLETPEDIAAGVVYLASDEASHVTGCELNISGGLWM